MSHTTRTSATGLLTRDGRQERSERRPRPTIRRAGTRAAVIAAALAELED